MLGEFKKIYMTNVFNLLKIKLQEIAEEHNLDYEELEKLYLEDIKTYIQSS